MNPPQTHHGVCVADIDSARTALATLGYTRIQPGAEEPLCYADTTDDQIGRWTCPDLGSPYRTHWVENPATGHQIDLIEIAPNEIRERPTDVPLSGDLTVVVPLPCADHAAATHVLRTLFGDRYDVVDGGPAWATLHLAASDWPASRSFLADVLGVGVRRIADDRYTLEGIGGRIDVAVSTHTPAVPDGLGKKYAGANHLRMLHRDLSGIARRAAMRDDVRWLIPPDNGFGFIAGPAGETIELFDEATGNPDLEASDE